MRTKNSIKLVLVFVLGFVTAGISVYAFTTTADQVSYDNMTSHLTSTNVKDAIDELYTKAGNNECAKGYVKGSTIQSGGYECVPPNFAIAPWDDIISAYNSNASWLQSDMEAGTTRDVDLGSLGTHKVRIANLKKCSEISVSSKTACGLVIEFADIINTHRMNVTDKNDTTTNGKNNKGGWEYSDMRAYVNSTTYANENTNYSSNGIFNSIPYDLRIKIIDTTVKSGRGGHDNSNFTTTDKLYLLSTKEVWNNCVGYDGVCYETRLLDYYNNKGVTLSNYAGASKKYNESDSSWWLRSPNYYSGDYFYGIGSSGNWENFGVSSTYGVSPAFRLAN